MQQSTPYLSFRGITMTFPGVKALSDISFDCYPGQIHALMGENGAGKSGNDSNLLIVFYVQIMPDDFVMQLHRF